MILSSRPRTIVATLGVAGVAGAFLLLPTLSFIGTMLAPSQPTPSQAHVSPLLGKAMWAVALGGRATELQPMNPFTIGRMVACHALAERFETRAERDSQHDECMKLMPAVEAVGYLSTVHMRSEGVWEDPRVPFVQIATMTMLSGTWTRTELLDTLAERGEFGPTFQGTEAASHGYFGRPANELTLPQAAMLAGLMGNRRIDPWCDPATTADRRRRALERMRNNRDINDVEFEAANRSELGLSEPPSGHPNCKA